MANFKEVAKRLGLEDIEKSISPMPYDKSCNDCNTKLRLGRDNQGCVWNYCPTCRKKIETIFAPRFQLIKVKPHDD